MTVCEKKKEKTKTAYPVVRRAAAGLPVRERGVKGHGSFVLGLCPEAFGWGLAAQHRGEGLGLRLDLLLPFR